MRLFRSGASGDMGPQLLLEKCFSGCQCEELQSLVKRVFEECSFETDARFDADFTDAANRCHQLNWNVCVVRDGKIAEFVYLVGDDLTAERASSRRLAAALKALRNQKRALDQAAIVAITDAHGIITYVNEKFVQISQYSRDELIGETHKIINSGYHQPEFFKGLWRTISGGNVWKGEIRNKSKDGSLYWVDTTIVPFLNERGKPYQYVSIRSDITDKKSNQALLEEQRNRMVFN